ncbi:MAG: pseudouridine synthase [Bacteroidetes bacterium]|nr:pseudouridine synthase [Bacteroidota bacterium]
MIGEGRVRVNGEAESPAYKIESWCEVVVDGKIIQPLKEFHYVRFYKPRGIECTLNEEIENNLRTVFNFPVKLFPVGRLDKESEGLLLMTDDGDLYSKIAWSEKEKEKEYFVTVHKEIDDDFVKKMSGGIEILGRKTKPAKIIPLKEDPFSFHMIITQGMNRQIRRMCYKLGFGVRVLKRIRIDNIFLGELESGEWEEIQLSAAVGSNQRQLSAAI